MQVVAPPTQILCKTIHRSEEAYRITFFKSQPSGMKLLIRTTPSWWKVRQFDFTPLRSTLYALFETKAAAKGSKPLIPLLFVRIQ